MIPAATRPEPALRGPQLGAKRRRATRFGKAVARFGAGVGVIRLSLFLWLRSYWRGRQLVRFFGGRGGGQKSGPVAIVPYYGNEALLPAFLDHHRRLGIEEFVFLDLSAGRKLGAVLAGESDCAVWLAPLGAAPQRALDWLNHLRRRYGCGRWCLSLEPNELLVYRHCETRQVADFTAFLETERRDHVYALLVDLYGDKPAAGLRLEKGEDPLSVLPYFDPLGYITSGPHRYRNVIARGGVRRRTLYCEAPRQSPALNRIPLVKWRWYYVYAAGTRLLMPPRLNTSHSNWHSSPTACLLSLALLDSDEGLVRAWLSEEGQVAAAGGRLSNPGLMELRRRPLKEDVSARFCGSESLVACGLINPGQWF